MGYTLAHSDEGTAQPLGSSALFVHRGRCDPERLFTATHVPLKSQVHVWSGVEWSGVEWDGWDAWLYDRCPTPVGAQSSKASVCHALQ